MAKVESKERGLTDEQAKSRGITYVKGGETRVLAKDWEDAENKLISYQRQIEKLTDQMNNLGKTSESNQPKIVPKPQGIENATKAASNASSKFGKLGKVLSAATSAMGSLNSLSLGNNKAMDKLGKTVGSITQK